MRRIILNIIEVVNDGVTIHLNCEAKNDHECRSSIFKVDKLCLPTLLSIMEAGTEVLGIDLKIKVPNSSSKEFEKYYSFSVKEKT